MPHSLQVVVVSWPRSNVICLRRIGCLRVRGLAGVLVIGMGDERLVHVVDSSVGHACWLDVGLDWVVDGGVCRGEGDELRIWLARCDP